MKYNGVNKPKCPGWWWCFPCPECEWYERYPNGLICRVVADDGCDKRGSYWPEMEGLGIMATFATDYFGFENPEHMGAVVGKWYGPIDNPLGNDT